MTRQTTRLPPGTWSAEPSSLVDPVGQVIHHEGRLLRGIRARFADEVPALLALAERHAWFDHGLVRTWETTLSTAEFPLVIEHQRVPFVTIRGEWPAEGLRRAALCLIDLSSALARTGYGIKDAHTWNLLFDGAAPRFTDFGSIRPLAEIDWAGWLHEFRKSFLTPLLVFASGQADLARALLREHLVGTGLWMIDHAPDRLLPGMPDGWPAPPYQAQEVLARLHDLVSGLRFPHAPTEWTDYAQPSGRTDEVQLRGKDRLVASLLDRLTFTTAIDLGTNRGLHAEMCAARAAQVLACDIDETCLDAIFLQSAAQSRAVLPLYLNLIWPASAGGAFQSIAPATDRLKCDVVLALALVHHVCLKWQFTPDAFVRGVVAFTRDAAIVEFVPADDWHVAQWNLPTPPGYSVDGMHAALSAHFAEVERIPIDPAPRMIFFCRGRSPLRLRRPGEASP